MNTLTVYSVVARHGNDESEYFVVAESISAAIVKLQNYWRESISEYALTVVWAKEECKPNRFLG